jgi:hypothetical protein
MSGRLNRYASPVRLEARLPGFFGFAVITILEKSAIHQGIFERG